ncbi:MAG: hypothetical protein JNL80_04325 [Phycisphaerae bacterium]|nr:hypothetical protein [Phycisphaerae bacterium]
METFDEVWHAIADENVDALPSDVDWNAIGEEFRPRAAEVRSNAELRILLESMLARLGRSHYGIIPGDLAEADDAAAPPPDNQHDDRAHVGDVHQHADGSTHRDDEPTGGSGDLGVWFRRVERSIRTVNPRPDGPAAAAGIQAGWELVAINGHRVHVPIDDLEPIERSLLFSPPKPGDAMRRYHAEHAAASRPLCDPGETQLLTLRDSEGVERQIPITAVSAGGEIVEFGNLPPLEARVETRLITPDEFAVAGLGDVQPPKRIGLIAFNIWMLPTGSAIDDAVDRYRDADAIILDLRGNPGGVGGLAMGIGGHFLSDPDSLGRMTNRGGAIDFRVNPRRVTTDGRRVEPYAGPLVILIDPLTASTSEIFAAGLQELGRATVIGQTSAGAALPSIARRLPNGDVLQMAVADFMTPKGNRIEGRGVTPDVEVTLTAELLRREPDPTLAAALRSILAGYAPASRRSTTPPPQSASGG